MAVVTLAEVQQWLERTKLTLTAVDPELAESARVTAFSNIAGAFDTSTWVDVASTPKLVRSAISMLIAAWEYQRIYSEEGDTLYGDKLEVRANELLVAISSGDIELEEFPGVAATSGLPEFYPNDLSNAAQVYDASGNYVADTDDVKFRMAGRF